MKKPGKAEEEKFKIVASAGARKIISDEEIPMLMRLLAPDFEKHKQKNAFNFLKLGIWVLKDGNELSIISKEEYEKVVGK